MLDDFALSLIKVVVVGLVELGSLLEGTNVGIELEGKELLGTDVEGKELGPVLDGIFVGKELLGIELEGTELDGPAVSYTHLTLPTNREV